MSPTQEGCLAAETITYLKSEARKLHKSAMAGDKLAVRRIRGKSPAVALGADIQRKHALAAIAREIGFENWKQAGDCFEGREGASWAEFLYPQRCHIHWNIWFATYEEAKAIHANHEGFLLPYKNQFMIVDADYILSLGLQPIDRAWSVMGRDWARPSSEDARGILALALVKRHLENI